MADETVQERRQVAWIGQGVTIEGRVTSRQDIRIDGHVHGTVESADYEVTLGAGSGVKADVTARSVVVGGTIEGNVTASERIRIEPTGVVLGDVVTSRLLIEDGGMLRGKADVAGTRQT